MNKSLKILGTFLILAYVRLAAPFGAAAQTQGLTYFSAGTTNGGTVLSWAIVPANSFNNGTPVVTSLSVTSDLATATCNFYRTTTNQVANFVSTTTSLPVTATNGFASGDIIVIRHLGDNTYEKRTLTTFTSGTNLTVTVAPIEACGVGDLIYRASKTPPNAASQIGVPATTINQQGACLYAGERGAPLLVEVNGTATCWLNNVAGFFAP